MLRRCRWAILSALLFTVSSLAQSVNAGVLNDAARSEPTFIMVPPRGVNTRTLNLQAAASLTIPFFSSTVKSPLDGNTYSYKMVGTNPFTTKVTTTVKYVPLLLRVHFADGTILDPTKPSCNDTVSVAQRLYGSPLFSPTPTTSNGVFVGDTQITDAFQRANFWKYVAGTNYHVLLSAAASPRVIDVTAPPGSQTAAGVCSGRQHNKGFVPFNTFDNLAMQIINRYATPNQLPLLATYNVFESFSGGSAVGYHSAYARSGGTQTYAVSAYTDPGIGHFFHPDIAAWSHEIGEWMDDPFVDNLTPSWGNFGQVSGCSNNFEVGDPLSGSRAFVLNYKGLPITLKSWRSFLGSTASRPPAPRENSRSTVRFQHLHRFAAERQSNLSEQSTRMGLRKPSAS